jgi:hypothetical protein
VRIELGELEPEPFRKDDIQAMDEEDELPALVRVQTYILYARRLTIETSDLPKA